MKELLIHLRVLGLFAQNAHNLAKGPLFFQDHCFLGEVYNAANTDYDSVVERIIGTEGPEQIDLKDILKLAYAGIKDLPCGQVKQNSEYMQHILDLEMKTCAIVENLAKTGISQGTLNMIAAIADCSEVRQYKLKQRLAK